MMPALIDRNARVALQNMLYRSHQIREHYYNLFYNLGYLLLFLVVVGGGLYYMYKTKETNDMKKRRETNRNIYVLEKLNNYNKNQLNIDGAYHSPMSYNNEQMSPLNSIEEKGSPHALDNLFEEKREEYYHHNRQNDVGLSGMIREQIRVPLHHRYNKRSSMTYEIPKYVGTNNAIETSLLQ
tara:strand:+ start:407 stop:952 length:546 start_codon:yes stop_codon:yes gene_type:complete